jgi:tRNA(Arg) A34 adenosine deaminase TadA
MSSDKATITEDDRRFLARAIELSREGVSSGTGGPFGAVVVKDGEIIGEGCNEVTTANDPTAHAEVVAIRNACRHIANFSLEGAVIYASCEPCPMCLASIYWARLSRLVYANTRHQAAAIGFDDAFLYDEVPLEPEKRSLPTTHLPSDDAESAFRLWQEKVDKVEY